MPSSEEISYSKHLSEYYDVLYSDKNYEKECDFLEDLFEEFSERKVKRILDLGCGTGEHLLSLINRGYKVVGIDGSPKMIEQARSKTKNLNFTPQLYCQSIESMDIGVKFDAAVCMFSVLNYITTNEGLERALNRIAKHLKPNALFIGDIWYGPAVINLKPEVRKKEVETEDGTLIRFAVPELKENKHLVEVNYDFILIEESLKRFSETHKVRYLYPKEIEKYLEEAGFKIKKMFKSFDFNKGPSLQTWNVVFVSEFSESYKGE